MDSLAGTRAFPLCAILMICAIDLKNAVKTENAANMKTSTNPLTEKTDNSEKVTEEQKDLVVHPRTDVLNATTNQKMKATVNRHTDHLLKTWLKDTSFNLKNVPKLAPFVDKIKLKLWTLSKNDKSIFTILTYNNESKIKEIWQDNKPLKVIIHGWFTTDKNERTVFAIKRAYIKKKNEYNVMTVDWSDTSIRINYFSTANAVKNVGIVIGHLLMRLTYLNFVSSEMIHLIGHSLGAHVAGSAGYTYYQGTGKLISRITGLDPPYPKFSDSWLFWNTNERLDRGDAAFVDVIKTTKGTIGLTVRIGHAEFHPNDGSSYQPGCHYRLNPLFSWICSHKRSSAYYMESVSECNVFESVQCTSFRNFVNGLCKYYKRSYMGHCADPSAHGDFYLITNDKKPFSTSLPTW